MSTEFIILGGAAAFFVACLAWAFWPRGQRVIAQAIAPLRQTPPIRSALQAMREEGESRAADILLDRMATRHADDIVKQFTEAIAPKAPGA